LQTNRHQVKSVHAFPVGPKSFAVQKAHTSYHLEQSILIATIVEEEVKQSVWKLHAEKLFKLCKVDTTLGLSEEVLVHCVLDCFEFQLYINWFVILTCAAIRQSGAHFNEKIINLKQISWWFERAWLPQGPLAELPHSASSA
jgi:hypothetical protein